MVDQRAATTTASAWAEGCRGSVLGGGGLMGSQGCSSPHPHTAWGLSRMRPALKDTSSEGCWL